MVGLHYYFDPLCGWCYGAAPLIRAAAALPGVALTLHAGGLMGGERRQPVTARVRSFVMAHDRRIHALSGQPFGEDYVNGLLRDESAVLDSRPPALAVLAAEALGGRPLDMLDRLQHAHYVEGRRIADEHVLCDIARQAGMDPLVFSAMMRTVHDTFDAHLVQTRSDMFRYGLRGFPALVLEHNGAGQALDVGAYLGLPDAFAAEVQARIGPLPGESLPPPGALRTTRPGAAAN